MAILSLAVEAGTALAFAYALVDLLGGDGQQLAHTMVYDRLFQ